MSAVLLALSWMLLTVEVLETKIFAYCLANNLIFVVVGVALLGFGAGGSALSVRRELGDPRGLVRGSLFATAISIVVAHAFFAHVSQELRFALDILTVATLAMLAAPYFTAGMAIAGILAAPGANLGLLYGTNLVGSALGCSSVFVLLGPLTAPQCLALCATAAALLGVVLGRRRILEGTVALALGGILFAAADTVFPYAPEPADSGQLSLLEKHLRQAAANRKGKILRAELVERFDRWDPTARVQVHEPVIETSDPEWRRLLAALPTMWFTQDSSFGSPLVAATPAAKAFYERTCYGAGYFRGRRGEDVLVIGLGGAPDVQTALHYEPRSVVGVDINRTTVRMVAEDFKGFLGDPYGDPRVRIVVRDGRSFVRGDRALYDHIQLSGVDTKSLLAAGTLAVNESYLYTRQAFGEYLSRLRPEGLLCIAYAGEALMHRMAVSAMAALEDLGAPEPWRHIVLLEQSQIVVVLVKRTPFTAVECDRLRDWLAACEQEDGTTGVFLLVYELLVPGGALSLMAPPRAIHVPDEETSDPVMRAAREGRLDRYLDSYGLDIRPVDDDRPFFFHLLRNESVWRDPPDYFQRLFTLVRIMAALAVLLIAGPLLVFRVRGIRVARNLPFAVYFACLGAGFILAEIGLIQRYVLFLGHQAYAFPVVIGGLLVAAGLGSLLSGRFVRPRRVVVGAVTVAVLAIAGQQLGLDALFGATAAWPLGARVLVATVVLLPLGVPLGMLFPTGLRVVRRSSPLFVPWAFGINGVFSVIGTTLVMPGAILFGFRAMAATAAAVYVAAALAVLARRGD